MNLSNLWVQVLGPEEIISSNRPPLIFKHRCVLRCRTLNHNPTWWIVRVKWSALVWLNVGRGIIRLSSGRVQRVWGIIDRWWGSTSRRVLLASLQTKHTHNQYLCLTDFLEHINLLKLWVEVLGPEEMISPNWTLLIFQHRGVLRCRTLNRNHTWWVVGVKWSALVWLNVGSVIVNHSSGRRSPASLETKSTNAHSQLNIPVFALTSENRTQPEGSQ